MIAFSRAAEGCLNHSIKMKNVGAAASGDLFLGPRAPLSWDEHSLFQAHVYPSVKWVPPLARK